jgi:hypothetical protein
VVVVVVVVDVDDELVVVDELELELVVVVVVVVVVVDGGEVELVEVVVGHTCVVFVPAGSVGSAVPAGTMYVVPSGSVTLVGHPAASAPGVQAARNATAKVATMPAKGLRLLNTVVCSSRPLSACCRDHEAA